MKLVVQISKADDAKAWSILQRHTPGVALPNRTFVISESAAGELRQAGIQFHVLSDEPHLLAGEGVAAGERI